MCARHNLNAPMSVIFRHFELKIKEFRGKENKWVECVYHVYLCILDKTDDQRESKG